MENCTLHFLDFFFLVKTTGIIVFILSLVKKIALKSTPPYENESYEIKNLSYGYTFVLKLENGENFFVKPFEICYIIL